MAKRDTIDLTKITIRVTHRSKEFEVPIVEFFDRKKLCYLVREKFRVSLQPMSDDEWRQSLVYNSNCEFPHPTEKRRHDLTVEELSTRLGYSITWRHLEENVELPTPIIRGTLQKPFWVFRGFDVEAYEQRQSEVSKDRA